MFIYFKRLTKKNYQTKSNKNEIDGNLNGEDSACKNINTYTAMGLVNFIVLKNESTIQKKIKMNSI
jgi:hypothetical protein